MLNFQIYHRGTWYKWWKWFGFYFILKNILWFNRNEKYIRRLSYSLKVNIFILLSDIPWFSTSLEGNTFSNISLLNYKSITSILFLLWHDFRVWMLVIIGESLKLLCLPFGDRILLIFELSSFIHFRYNTVIILPV